MNKRRKKLLTEPFGETDRLYSDQVATIPNQTMSTKSFNTIHAYLERQGQAYWNLEGGLDEGNQNIHHETITTVSLVNIYHFT